MVVVLGVPRGNVVGKTFIVPSVGVALRIAEAAAAFVLRFIACVRSPSAELAAGYRVDATKAVRLAGGAADAHAVLERVGDVLQQLQCVDER